MSLDKAVLAGAIDAWQAGDPAMIAAMPRAARARRPRGMGAPAPAVVIPDPVVPVPSGDRIKSGTRVLRPNGQVYVARKVTADLSDVQWLRDAHAADMPVLLYGPPGTGKTALIEAAFGEDVITMLGSEDTERADFEGSYVQLADGSFLWVDGPLLRAMTQGVPLFVDEVGVISPKVLTLLYSAMDGRQEVLVNANPERGIVKAAPGFMVVAATNPHAPGVRLSEALLSRFVMQAEMGTDWSVARALGLPTEIAAAFQNLDKKREAQEIAASPQMREALAFVKCDRTFGRAMALSNLVAASLESDRPVIADVLSRAVGDKVKPLALG